MTDPRQAQTERRGMVRRFLAAAGIITAVSAGAVSTAALLEVKEAGNAFAEFTQPLKADVKGALDDVVPGGPQTIMLLGSDRRFADIKAGAPSRSDTIILLRLDPDRDAMAVMSIPRDLKVEIPTRNGVVTDKINAAYSVGGPKTTVQTVRRLLGIPINHVVNVNFGGFQRAVNRLGCFYQDVDRSYFNDNDPPTLSNANYATIDVKAGYQLLCGGDTLDWVRFRHLDDDFVRAARQQEFIRQAKQQIRGSAIFRDRNDLLRIFGRYTQTDIDPKNEAAILNLLKLGLESSKTPLREVRFRAGQDVGNTYVTISDANLKRAIREFTEFEASSGGRQTREPAPRPGRRKSRKKALSGALAPSLVMDRVGGEDHALDLAIDAGFPVYYPRVRYGPGGYANDSPYRYTLRTRERSKYKAYRIFLRYGNEAGQYYGVQGMTWRTPPILKDTHETERLRGRTLRIYYDGSRIRMIAWSTPRAVYWVSNTLSQRLSNRQMRDIAKHLTRVGQ